MTAAISAPAIAAAPTSAATSQSSAAVSRPHGAAKPGAAPFDLLMQLSLTDGESQDALTPTAAPESADAEGEQDQQPAEEQNSATLVVAPPVAQPLPLPPAPSAIAPSGATAPIGSSPNSPPPPAAAPAASPDAASTSPAPSAESPVSAPSPKTPAAVALASAAPSAAQRSAPPQEENATETAPSPKVWPAPLQTATPNAQAAPFQLDPPPPAPQSQPPQQPPQQPLTASGTAAPDLRPPMPSPVAHSGGPPPTDDGIRIAIAAGERLDIRIDAADRPMADRVAAEIDLLHQDLTAIGSEVEAIRVEVRNERGTHTPEASFSGRQPGDGRMGEALQQQGRRPEADGQGQSGRGGSQKERQGRDVEIAMQAAPQRRAAMRKVDRYG